MSNPAVDQTHRQWKNNISGRGCNHLHSNSLYQWNQIWKYTKTDMCTSIGGKTRPLVDGSTAFLYYVAHFTLINNAASRDLYRTLPYLWFGLFFWFYGTPIIQTVLFVSNNKVLSYRGTRRGMILQLPFNYQIPAEKLNSSHPSLPEHTQPHRPQNLGRIAVLCGLWE